MRNIFLGVLVGKFPPSNGNNWTSTGLKQYYDLLHMSERPGKIRHDVRFAGCKNSLSVLVNREIVGYKNYKQCDKYLELNDSCTANFYKHSIIL